MLSAAPCWTLSEAIGDDHVSVAINCLDGVSDAVLADAPVSYASGRDKAWWKAPTEVRRL